MPPRGRRRVDPAERSLACLLQSLEGARLVIELRSDVIVRATLESVDEFMNMMLSSAAVQMLDGARNSYDVMYLKGRNIRFVHLPKSLDPAKAILAQRQKIVDVRVAAVKDRLRNPLGRLEKGGGDRSIADDGRRSTDDEAQVVLQSDDSDCENA